MGIVGTVCFLFLIATTTLHYELLPLYTALLPRLPIPPRLQLVFLIIGAFDAHFVKILPYIVGY